MKLKLEEPIFQALPYSKDPNLSLGSSNLKLLYRYQNSKMVSQMRDPKKQKKPRRNNTRFRKDQQIKLT